MHVCALQVHSLDLTDNLLTGPAFPPAWVAPGALPSLRHLSLSGNANLTGTLPANLPGSQLATLWVAPCGLHTLLPSEPCHLLQLQPGGLAHCLAALLIALCASVASHGDACRALDRTEVEGSIPSSWCQGRKLARL